MLLGLVLLISLSALGASFVFATQPSYDIASPHDRISEDKIHVYEDKIVIDVQGASWATYADTNSMDPVLDKGVNGIEIKPQGEDDLHIGDIVAYEPDKFRGLVIHRIVNIQEDEEGKYFTLQGDNNQNTDPEKVRFNQIQWVLIGVIY